MQRYMQSFTLNRIKPKTTVIIILALGLYSLPGRAGEVITRERFVSLALQENLDSKVAAARVSSARATAGSFLLPAPMVGFTQMRVQDDVAAGFEVSQSLPFPSRISHDRSARQIEVDARIAAQRSSEREVDAQARLLYFQIWQRQERVSLLQEKKRAVEQHIKLATAGARSDSFQKIHVIKAESELDLLENEVLQATQEAREIQIEAARFVNLDTLVFKPVATEMPLTTLPRELDLVTPLQLEVPKLELAVLRAREREANSARFPDLNLRYRETDGTKMSPRTSELMIGITLPFLFFWEADSVSERATSDRFIAELRLQQEQKNFAAERALLLSRAYAFQKQLEQIRERLLPRAEKRLRLVHNLAPRDLEILQDHRETMELIPDLKLKALEIRGQYEAVVADLKKYESRSEK